MTKDELQAIRDMCKRNNTRFPSDVMMVVLDALEQAYAENEQLRQEIASHAPEGRNYTNEQYVALQQENERLRQVLHDIWYLADSESLDHAIMTVVKIRREASKALEGDNE